MFRFTISLLLISIILTGVPLLGTWWQGQDLALHLSLPHITQKVEHAAFFLPAWIGMALFVVIIIVILIFILSRPFKSCTPIERPTTYSFPWWGTAGLLLIIVFWILAWNRFTWFAEFQQHTFTPLWCGYILTINAVIIRRKGSCLLTAHPGYFISLFILSALFWWYFEYLNTWVNNWYYVGTESLSDIQIIIHSSLAYATVLPAVTGTTEWLTTFSLLNNSCRNLWQLRLQRRTSWAVTSLTGGSLLLLLVTNYEEILFPLAWITPLFIIIGIRNLLKSCSVFSLIGNGHWHSVILPALAALFCGFFWELWNFRSFAHWEYSVPYVQTIHIFEMPLLGYAGYLPFGLTCLAVAELLPNGRRVLQKQVLSVESRQN